jgi:hypothetical protein
MDTVTPNSAQISLFGDEELPIVDDPMAQEAPPPPPKKTRIRTAAPEPTPQQIAERAIIERDAAARRKKYLAKKAREARPPVARRVRHRWENAYD